MFAALKIGCLVVYALALCALAGLLHGTLATVLELLGALFVVVHLIELPFAFKYLDRYPGPFAVSVLLCLLYGLFHWQPLARQARA